MAPANGNKKMTPQWSIDKRHRLAPQNRHPKEGVVSDDRVAGHHAPGNGRNDPTEASHGRTDQSKCRFWQLDDPKIGAGEGQEESGHAVDQHPGGDDEEGRGCPDDPCSRRDDETPSRGLRT